MTDLKIYLVGGAVRDRLLGYKVNEKDWVVIGSSPEEMKKKGFYQVGRNFPVFINRKSGEEYALARTEHKTATGYHGFDFDYEPDVTLEEDLLRRDLTINAMAESSDGELIDPFGGLKDLQNRILRHTSEAFAEDPLRVLRVARFATRFHSLNFKIAAETMTLMRQIADSGELQTLVQERIWKETQRALKEPDPQVYFATLVKCGALGILFPELRGLEPAFDGNDYSKAQIDSDSRLQAAILARNSLQAAVAIGKSSIIRLAALLHNADEYSMPGKGTDQPVRLLCQRLKMSRQYSGMAQLAATCVRKIVNSDQSDHEQLLKLLEQLDAWRRPKRFNTLLAVCRCRLIAAGAALDSDPPIVQRLKRAHDLTASISIVQLRKKNLHGREIARELHKLRLAILYNKL